MDTVDNLLEAAFTEPERAYELAETRLEGASPSEQSGLLRAMGNARREQRRTDEAVALLRRSVDAAERAQNEQLLGLAMMSLAASLSYQGNFEESIRLGEEAAEVLQGDNYAIALSQLAGLLQRASRHSEALDAFDAALAATDAATDQTIKGDIWSNRGVLLGFDGRIAEAEADTTKSLQVFAEQGWLKRAADKRHNLAWLAGRRGDVPEALRIFDQAKKEYELAGVSAASIFPDQCEVLVSAGLATEAHGIAMSASASFLDAGNNIDAAESLLLAARASLLIHDYRTALNCSQTAATQFADSGRTGWGLEATVVSLDARTQLGSIDEASLTEAQALVEKVALAGWFPAKSASRLVCAELAMAAGQPAVAIEVLADLDRELMPIADRFRYDFICATQEMGDGDPASALTLCEESLIDFQSLSAALGGTELRANAARHVARISELAIALAVDSEDAGTVLRCAELRHGAMLHTPPLLPPENPELEARLNELRATLAKLDAAALGGEERAELEKIGQYASELQDRVRQLTRHDAGPGDSLLVGSDEPATPHTNGDCVISFVVADSEVYAAISSAGHEAIHPIGPLGPTLDAVFELRETLSAHLASAARGIDADASELTTEAAALGSRLFPVTLPDTPLLISPAPELGDIPWGLLPQLNTAAFVLAPSVAVHRFGASGPRPDRDHIVAVAGPDLAHSIDEATRVCTAYPRGEALTEDVASVDAVKDRLADVDVVHFSCHGSFLTQSPLFSSLQLADGPLFGHELERLSALPPLIVLSACDTGRHAAIEGSRLGLVTSLLAGGAQSIIAAAVPIPDSASTAEMMAELHRRLAQGESSSSALREARAKHPILAGAFASFGPH